MSAEPAPAPTPEQLAQAHADTVCTCNGFPDYFEGYAHSIYEHELAREELKQREVDCLAEAVAKAMSATASSPTKSPVELTSDLFEQWRREVGAVVSDKWWATRSYHYGHIAKHFGSVTGLASDALHTTFKSARLAKCGRETHKKERGTLAALFDWLETKPWSFRRPTLPKLGKKDRGTRDPNRKAAPVEMTEAEVEALIAHLPETTSRERREGSALRPIRDAVLTEWDTSLRPSTIERLKVPDHWQPDRPSELFIAAGIDKEEYERTLPLTPRLIELFKRRHAAMVDGKGLVFGPYQSALRGHWYAAAKAASIDERRAKKVSVYDFRHAAGKRFLDATGNIRGAAYMLGHRNATSTHRYTRPDKAAGDTLVAALARSGPSASTDALAPVVGGSETGTIVLDETQTSDYTTASHREGGGTGRRTSLRC